MTTRATVELEERLAFALQRIADLASQLDRAREENASRDATLRALTDAWQTIDGRTQRHEASVESVRAISASVSAIEARLEQETQLRRDALAALGQGVARDRDATEIVVAQLDDLESRLDDTARLTAGAGAQRLTQAEVLRDLDHRLDRLHDTVAGLDARVAAEREVALAAANDRADLEARLLALSSALAEQEVRVRESQHERRALGESVAELQAMGHPDAQLRDLLDQQRVTRQRLEERFRELESGVRDLGRAALEAAEQRAQIRLQVAQLGTRVDDLAAQQEATRHLLVTGLRAMAVIEDRASQRDTAESERRVRERREALNRIEEQADQAARGLPL